MAARRARPRAVRGAVTNGQRRADAIGALLHAGHAESRCGSVARDAAAVVRHGQSHATDCTVEARIVMRRAREWRTALVNASCAMPMISRSTASPRRGSSSTTRSIGVWAVR